MVSSTGKAPPEQEKSRDCAGVPRDLGSFFCSTGRPLSFWPKVAAGARVITSALQMVGGREIPCRSCLTGPLAAHQPELIRRLHPAARKARIHGLSAVLQCAPLSSGILFLKEGAEWELEQAISTLVYTTHCGENFEP